MISRNFLGCIAFGLLITFASCKKDEELEKGQLCDYAPYTIGSTFTFASTTSDFFTGGMTTTESTSEVLGTEEYLGQNWVVGENLSVGNQSGDIGTGLVRCDETGTYALVKSANVDGVQINDLQIQLLSLPATLGKKWESEPFSISSSGITNTITYKSEITNIGLNMTVNGNTFEDVIEVREFAITEVNGFSFQGATTYRYYDKAVGNIRSLVLTDSFFGVDTTLVSDLVAWDIK
ncbi:MAG: hypothetical protein AAF985_04840 [Bacteroidota bacterium]